MTNDEVLALIEVAREARKVAEAASDESTALFTKMRESRDRAKDAWEVADAAKLAVLKAIYGAEAV